MSKIGMLWTVMAERTVASRNASNQEGQSLEGCMLLIIDNKCADAQIGATD